MLLKISGVNITMTGIYVMSPYYIDNPKNLQIGRGVFINRGVIFEGNGDIVIGNKCQIGPYVVFATTNHSFVNWNEQIDGITVGDNVWIGSHVTIVPGITIRSNTIIGAGSVVTRNIGPGVFAGAPAVAISSTPL